MKLKKGERYDVAALRFRGEWTEGDGSGHDGYDIWHYFHPDGTYRGPDPHGIEPVFDEDE